MPLGPEPRWRSSRMCSHFLLWEHQNHNYLLDNHWQEDTGTHQKRYPTSKDKGEATMRPYEWRNHSKIKSHNCRVGDSQTGEHLYHRSPPTGVKVLSPQVRLPNLGVRQREEEFLENQTLKASGIWLQDFNRTRGNTDSTLGKHTQNSVSIGIQGKE